ncbi:hypothetical protein GCM10010277_86220 [Streptomyces longisporoflavus]|nr:hypothetical protein GCM10010277_86220 [Streptomyces longisporoflavus]
MRSPAACATGTVAPVDCLPDTLLFLADLQAIAVRWPAAQTVTRDRREHPESRSRQPLDL